MPSNYKNSNRSDNKLTVADYLSLCNSDEQRQQLIFLMDITMKNLHINNYYVANFHPDYILVYENKSGLNIDYRSVTHGCNDFFKQQNIFYLSCFAIGVYSTCLKYINPKEPNFLIENFNEFAQLVPSDDVPYYRGVIVRGSSVYYSDFVKARKEQEISSIQSVTNSSNGITLTKSTLIGKMNAKEDLDQSAFISILLFPILMLVGFIIPFLIVLFS